MRGTLIIFRRELAGLFAAPLAWILLFVALLLNGLLFSLVLNQTQGDVTASLEFVFGGNFFFWALMLVLSPLLAMRLLTEEAASGTLEYLRTAPVSDAAVVTGKFLAGTAFMATLWSSLLIYAAALALWGVAPDWGQVVTIFLGSVLCSALFVAIGLVACSLTNIPLLGAFLAFMACLWWVLMPALGGMLLVQMRVLFADLFGSFEVAEAWIGGALERMDVRRHFGNSYFQGVLDSAEVIFFLTWISLFLFLTTRSLEARRWRG